MSTKHLLLSALMLTGAVVASAQNTETAEPTLNKVHYLSPKASFELKEGQTMLYHETFDKIGGSLESPIEVTTDAKRVIDPSLLDETEGYSVAISTDVRGVGGGLMVSDVDKGYIGINFDNLEGRHRTYDLYFRVRTASPGQESRFKLSFYEMYIQSGEALSGVANEEGDNSFYSLPGRTDGSTMFSLEFTNGNDVPFIVDEVFVVVPDTVINGAVVKAATDISDDGFTANWRYSYDAIGGLFEVFTYADEATEHEPVSVSEQFSGISVNGSNLNVSSPNMPESWTYRFSKEMNKKVESHNGGYAIYLNKTIEDITTPNYDELPYSALSFDVKGAAASNAKLVVEERIPFPIDERGIRVRDSYKWNTLAELPLSEYTEFTTVDLTEKLSGEGIYVRFRISDDDLNNGAAVSNINFTYGGGTYYDKEYVEGFENLDVPVELNSMAVAGLNPEKSYFYRVRAYDENYISDYSYKQSAKGTLYGSSVVRPVVLEPTNVDDKNGSFTANWQFNPLFDYKVCEVWKEKSFTADQDEYVAFSADFSKVEGGTATPEAPKVESYVERPTYYYVEGLPGFKAKYATYADGMFGVSSGVSYGTLTSPVYSLGDGNLTLKLNVAAGKIGDECLVTCYNDATGDFTSTRKFTITEIPQAVELQFPASNYTYFYLYYNGTTNIMFDKFEVVVDGREGDKMLTMVDEKLTKDVSADFELKNMLNEESYYYRLRHWYVVGDEYGGVTEALSSYSGNMYVWKNYVDVESTVADEVKTNIYATSEGLVNMDLAKESVVYIYNTSGMLVDSFKAAAGHNTYRLTDKGIYVVVVGDQHVKVVY